MSVYPALPSIPHSGDEPLLNTTLSSYWAWAHSNLMDNAERGALAEFLVKQAVGDESATRTNWDAYDLLSPEGIKVEIKASGYLQSWEQDKLSNIVFSIRPTYGWDARTNSTDTVMRRQSDVYVFCLHKHKEQSTVNPLDIEQWEFYVVPTRTLNEKCGDQKTISLSGLQALGIEPVAYDSIKKEILRTTNAQERISETDRRES